MSTEERYARAIRTSHLECDDAPGDIDAIIAAGMAETLGTMLARLRAEWDTVGRKEREQAANDLTARVLILMNLRSLGPVKQALYGFVQQQARIKSTEMSNEDAAKLTGRVLDVWLDRICESCEGRGFTGGYGIPKTLCPKCHGSGDRRQGRLSANQAEHTFGIWLLGVMDVKCAGALGQMKRRLHENIG